MKSPKKKTIIQINRGGFGRIDRIKLDDGTHVARKTFDPENTEKLNKEEIDKLRNRFIREVLTQKQLPEDSVIPILDYDLSGESPWYTMPLAKRVFCDEIETARWSNQTPEGLSDILNSLEVIHDLGYVHRDVKPQTFYFMKVAGNSLILD